MKKLTLFTLAVLLAAQLFAQSSTRELSSFTKVAAGESIEVFLTKGAKESARIVTDGIDLDEVMTEVSGGKLSIFLEGNSYRNVDVKVYVTFVKLDGVKASSSASVTMKERYVTEGDFDIACSSSGDISMELKANSVDLDVSSSGDVDIMIEANELDIEVSSSGEINISGSVQELEASASSSGEIDGYELVVKNADVRASSGASIKINVTDSIDGRASSGASIRYKGSPSNTSVDSSSGGSVRKY
jgi:hypothetical protein